MAFEYRSILDIIKNQAESYIGASSVFKTLYPTFIERIKLGNIGIETIDKLGKFWQNIIELQVRQVQQETGGDLASAARIVGKTYEDALAKNGLSLSRLKDLLPTDLAEILGFTKTPGWWIKIREFVFDTIGFKRTGLLTVEEISAAASVNFVIPPLVAGALGITAAALPLYLYLRNQIQGFSDEIDKITEDTLKTQIVFKNRKIITLDSTNKTNPKIIESAPPINLKAPIGSAENPITSANYAQFKALAGRPRTTFTASPDALTLR